MKNVYFLLAPDIVLFDFAAAADSFRIANQYGANYKLHYVQASTGDSHSKNGFVSSSLGVIVGEVSLLPKTIEDNSIIVVPGAASFTDESKSEILEPYVRWLDHINNQANVTILCICAATFLAAKAGLLNKRKCTTHHSLYSLLTERYPDLKVVENRVFVKAENLFTCAGATSGVDLILHFIEEDVSALNAQHIAKDLVIYFKRSENDEQLSPWIRYRNHINGRVHKVQDHIINNPCNSYSIEELAALVHITERHLTRIFKNSTGVSVNDYQRKIKVSYAKQMLANSRSSIESIAMECGFSSAQQLKRAWNKFETVSINDYRSQRQLLYN